MRLPHTLALLGTLAASPAFAQDAPDGTASDAPICERKATASELQLAIDAAQASWADLEFETFVKNTDKIRGMVPCLSEELIRPHAARLHRFEGLRAFVDEDTEAAKAAFAASRTIEPNYRFPTSIVPEGNPVHEVYDAKEAREPAQETIGAPKEGRIQLDGSLSLQRNTDLPMVVQLFDDEGAVTTTTYVHPGEPLPAYDALPIGASGGYNYDGTGKALRVPLGVGAALTGVAAIGLYSVAVSKKSKWNNDDTPMDELDALRTTANTFGAAGIGVGVVAVGLGTGAVIVGRF